MDSDDEDLLDRLGTVTVTLGIAVIVYGIFAAENLSQFLDVVQAGQPLVIGGIAAVVGGSAVKAWLRNR